MPRQLPAAPDGLADAGGMVAGTAFGAVVAADTVPVPDPACVVDVPPLPEVTDVGPPRESPGAPAAFDDAADEEQPAAASTAQASAVDRAIREEAFISRLLGRAV